MRVDLCETRHAPAHGVSNRAAGSHFPGLRGTAMSNQMPTEKEAIRVNRPRRMRLLAVHRARRIGAPDDLHSRIRATKEQLAQRMEQMWRRNLRR